MQVLCRVMLHSCIANFSIDILNARNRGHPVTVLGHGINRAVDVRLFSHQIPRRPREKLSLFSAASDIRVTA